MSKHIVIIGGGILGCLSALRLSEAGHRITVVEQGSIGGNAHGAASWAAAGILFPLLPWAYSDAVNRLAVAGMRAYPALCRQLQADTGIDPEYQQDGIVLLPSVDAAKAHDWAARYGFALHDAVPGAAYPAGAIWLPEIAHVRPPRLLQSLRQWLVRRGVQLREGAPLAPVGLEGQPHRLEHVVTAAGEKIEADAFVLAGGAWSQQWLGEHALGLQVKPMRGQMLLYPQPETPLRHMLFREGFYLVPRRDGYILAGSCVEDVGFAHATTAAMAQELAAKAASVFPALAGIPYLRHWSGFRPGSPDNLPAIARHPYLTDLYLNTGHFRYGLTMAPSSADILAAVMSGDSARVAALDAAAYAYPR